MRNKIIVLLMFAILIVGCKDEQKKRLVIKDDIDNLFNLNNYKISIEQKINDSTVQYEGENERFLIKGKYNYLKKYKIGWWNVYDKRSKEKYLDIEFYKDYYKTKELDNQIIFYKKNEIDTSNSKFYTAKYNDKVILYNFYCPKSSDETYSAKINIGIISNEKPLLYPTGFDCKKIINGNYQYSLDISKYQKKQKLNMIGSFSEYSINKIKNELGINEIVLDDTIIIR